MSNHRKTLEFELGALKTLLESQKGNMLIYKRSMEDNKDKDELQYKASKSVFNEYVGKHIPRTQRHIEALEWILNA